MSVLGIVCLALLVFVLLRWVARVVSGRPSTSIVQFKMDPEQFDYIKVLVSKSKEE